MRMVVAILSAAVAALTMLGSPVLAKNAEAQKVGEPAAVACSSYQKAENGTWTRIPCQEVGATPEQRTRPATHSSNQAR
jgi:hypothetical protein